MNEQDRIALFDLDGTLADYTSQLTKDLNSLKSPQEQMVLLKGFDEEDPHIERRRQLITGQLGWWRSLPRVEYVFKLYYYLTCELKYKANILTKGPSSNPQAWGEKLDWCRAHVPEANVTITEDKSLVYGKILVDDYPNYVTGWLKFRPRGLVIMPEHSYNQRFSHPQVVKLNPSNLKEVKRRILRLEENV